MKITGYFLFLILCFALFYAIGYYFEETKSSALTHEAVRPDILLSNSKIYFQEDAHTRSIKHLDQAISAIKQLEQDLDPESKAKVDEAITELEEVFNEMISDSFNVKKLNEASIKALNALTYAELKISEHYVESNELDKARMALKYGMLHVKNALMFSEGEKKEYEVHIYSEMDSIIENSELSDRQIIQRLEGMILELDSLGLQLD